jgi:hypothetical protein
MESSNSMVQLTASNYSIWKTRMEDILYCKDLFDPIELEGVKPISTTNEDWNKMNRKAVGYIRQWIDQSVFHHVPKRLMLIVFGRSWRVFMNERLLKTKPL